MYGFSCVGYFFLISKMFSHHIKRGHNLVLPCAIKASVLWITNVSWFAQDFPDSETESSVSQEPL